jgi:predicted porin
MSIQEFSKGIIIPAGDWTLDIGGVVNTFYTGTKTSGTAGANGIGATSAAQAGNSSDVTTGLLPNYLSVSGKTRQNDLDVAFTISINPGASTTGGSQYENRQAFLTFGDASWGSIKVGKDLGIYARDPILSDMTLLDVGAGALTGSSTLGRIGTGFMYADWKAQISYTSPIFNGFQFTGGVSEAWDATGTTGISSATSSSRRPAFEAKASYGFGFGTDDVTGRVWVSGISQKVEGLKYSGSPATNSTATASGTTIGFSAASGDKGKVLAYYGNGKGTGQGLFLQNAFDNAGTGRETKDYYVQGNYTLPGVGTKLGVSYGESKLMGADDGNIVNHSALTAYHPLTKHVNLVAEYANMKEENTSSGTSTIGKARTVSVGAIWVF